MIQKYLHQLNVLNLSGSTIDFTIIRSIVLFWVGAKKEEIACKTKSCLNSSPPSVILGIIRSSNSKEIAAYVSLKPKKDLNCCFNEKSGLYLLAHLETISTSLFGFKGRQTHHIHLVQKLKSTSKSLWKTCNYKDQKNQQAYQTWKLDFYLTSN